MGAVPNSRSLLSDSTALWDLFLMSRAGHSGEFREISQKLLRTLTRWYINSITAPSSYVPQSKIVRKYIKREYDRIEEIRMDMDQQPRSRQEV